MKEIKAKVDELIDINLDEVYEALAAGEEVLLKPEKKKIELQAGKYFFNINRQTHERYGL